MLTSDHCAESWLRPNMQKSIAYFDVQRAERRKRMRIRLHWRVDLLAVRDSHGIESVTRDLSTCGFYCLSPVPLVPGERIRYKLERAAVWPYCPLASPAP